MTVRKGGPGAGLPPAAAPAALFSAAVFVAAASAAAVLPASAAQAQAGGGAAAANKTISEVVIRGTVRTAPLAARLAAEAAGIKAGTVFQAKNLADARQRIRDVGLYSSVAGLTEDAPDGSLRVVFEVVENPVVEQIKITGNISIKAEELIAKAGGGLQTKPGNVLNAQTYSRDLQAIQRYYQGKGYAAFVSPESAVDPKTGILNIIIAEAIVEEIVVEGVKKTRPEVVLRELRTQVGKPYNVGLLQRDISRVFATNIFADVAQPRIEDGSDVDRVRIVLPVQEQRTGQVGVIFGYSVRQRLTGTLQLTETNFRGLGEVVNLQWTVGGIVAANQFDVGFTEPWLDKNHTSLSANVYNQLNFRFNRVFTDNASSGQDDDPYYEIRKGGALTLSRPLSEFTRVFASFRTESVNANNLDLGLNDPRQDYSQQDIENIRGALVSNGNVNSVTLRALTNTRDNELDPASGFFFSPSVEFGNGNFRYSDPVPNTGQRFETEGIRGFDFSKSATDEVNENIPRAFFEERTQTGAFTKFSVDMRRYFSLDGPRRTSVREPKRVLATRLLVGTSTGNIGFAEQYFLGGVDTLRGYADDRFWGNNLFLFSTELRVPLDRRSNNSSIAGVLFVDVGDAWGATDVNREDIPGFGQHQGFRPNVGFGIGARIKTPVGPVRLDYGFGEVGRFHFAIGQSF